MKILYCANIRLPTEKAHGVQIMKMCEAFAALGHEVTLAVPKRRNEISDDPFAYYSVKQNFTVVRFRSFDRVRFWGRIGFYVQSVWFAFSCTAYGKHVRPDLFYTRDPEVAAVAGLQKIRPLVFEAHTISHGPFIRAALSRAHKVVCISQGLAKALQASGLIKAKTIIAHDGVDLAEFDAHKDRKLLRRDLSLPIDKSIIAYVGKFRIMGESKGVEDIIAAVGALHRQRSDVFLVWVGYNPDEAMEAHAAAQEAQLSPDEYRFIPHVVHGLVPKYLQAADVLIMNAPQAPYYAPVMSPLKFFEYMGSGTPAVVPDLPSLREVVSDAEIFLVPPYDRGALAQAIAEVLDNPEAAAAKAAAARKKVERYTWHARAEHILKSL